MWLLLPAYVLLPPALGQSNFVDKNVGEQPIQIYETVLFRKPYGLVFSLKLKHLPITSIMYTINIVFYSVVLSYYRCTHLDIGKKYVQVFVIEKLEKFFQEQNNRYYQRLCSFINVKTNRLYVTLPNAGYVTKLRSQIYQEASKQIECS